MSELSETEVLERLMGMVARYGIQELEVEEGTLHVRVRAIDPPGSLDDEAAENGSAYIWRLPTWMESKNEGAAPASDRTASAVPLTAPLTGVFYRSPAPDTPPFVEVGQVVEEGQTIGVIEAMKVFSNVPADCSGTVVEIVAQNGRLVQHGDLLLYIDPTQPAT